MVSGREREDLAKDVRMKRHATPIICLLSRLSIPSSPSLLVGLVSDEGLEGECPPLQTVIITTPITISSPRDTNRLSSTSFRATGWLVMCIEWERRAKRNEEKRRDVREPSGSLPFSLLLFSLSLSFFPS